ncbi:MAG: hypothetical protein NXH75_11100 [Halobacteriovoraceae bacterium]|nr:hypothetical protein [Halobacteriovoraceae bacterium]
MNQPSRGNTSKGQGNSKKKGRPPRSAKSAQNGKRRRNSRPRKNSGGGNKPQGFEKFHRSYLNLLERHLDARKKYYELFHRADPKQLAKLEKNFYRTLDELRSHEEKVRPEDEEKFKKLIDGLELDTTYSNNHELPLHAEVLVKEEEIEDPHLLPTQVDHEFKGDAEESMGSIEDYRKYKGLPEEA